MIAEILQEAIVPLAIAALIWALSKDNPDLEREEAEKTKAWNDSE